MPTAVREAVFARSGGHCDLCGVLLNPQAWECHHRKLRSQGGLDQLANLLALHPYCHQQAHHRPAWACERGFIVPSHGDPARQPIWLHGRRWAVAELHWVLVDDPTGDSPP